MGFLGAGREYERDGGAREARLVSANSVQCRCRPSAVRVVLNAVKQKIDEQTWHQLELMHLDKFFELPPYPQSHLVTAHLIKCWDVDRRAFILGGKQVKFDANHVALLIGMPNSGSPASWENAPPANMDARKIKDAVLQFAEGESSHLLLQLLIKFIMSNLFFPSANFRVSKGMSSICENVETFSLYNWPETICRFLTEQLDVCSMKLRRSKPFGYLSGFVFLLTIWFYERTTLVTPTLPSVRPRMLRWPLQVNWNHINIELLFNQLRPDEVHDNFIEIFDSEQVLLFHSCEEASMPAVAVARDDTHSVRHLPSHVDATAIVPYHIIPDPLHSDTHREDTPQTTLADILHLMKEHHSLFLEFKSTVDTRLERLENKITYLYERVQQPSMGTPISRMARSTKYSLIQRIKERVGRRKKGPTSPFVVFERKRQKKLVESLKDVDASVAAESVVPHQSTPAVPSTPVKSFDVEGQLTPQKTCPAVVVLDFPGRELIPQYMRDTIDRCCNTFNDKSDLVFFTEKSTLTRQYLDEILTNGWLGNEAVDCFAMILQHKTSASPDLYKPFLYVSPCHWIWKSMTVKQIVEHTTPQSVETAELILFPIIDNQHWTLLVCFLKEQKWRFYDSLPNKMHMTITRHIIKHFLNDAEDAFREDISQWEVISTKGLPKQLNSFDCGVFVCKYMETIVQKEKVEWKDKLGWQEHMPLFRAEFGYDICNYAVSHIRSTREKALKGVCFLILLRTGIGESKFSKDQAFQVCILPAFELREEPCIHRNVSLECILPKTLNFA